VRVTEDIAEKKTAEENLEKVRLEKARELEQVRRRIAAELHDDIGSSLTQISILSGVLRRKNGKEIVNNIVRHAACGAVEIAFKIEEGEIRLLIRDDGCGFAVQNKNGSGHGLSSMKDRARSLDGDLKIRSGERSGTIVELCAPLIGISNPKSQISDS